MPPSMRTLKLGLQTTGLLEKATSAAGALRDVSSCCQVPFLRAISASSLAIFEMIQRLKTYKQEHTRLVEQIHELLWVIIELCVNEDAADLLPPSITHTIGEFAAVLLKIRSALEAQFNMGKLKRFLRAGNVQQWEELTTGLKLVLERFALQSSVVATIGLARVHLDEEAYHAELLTLIEVLSTSTTTSGAFSSITGRLSDFADSTQSVSSMLPATPKIFHGRDTEIEELLIALRQDSPRVAILGSGGMGKTSLATAVMHHPEVADKFQQRHFIACDAAPTLADLVYIVASHLNCESSKNSIVSTLSAGPPLLVVLDNMETPWEPVASRSEVEEFLSLLTDIPHLALMITMRGLERPGKVRWTRPFLQPLLPLSHSAARQTFIEIADVSEGIDEVLALTDYLPLAVSLVASVVSFEGTDTVLRRWKEERTTILSAGHDKRSNLEMSIAMSLSSPRMIMFPGTRDLLGVISLLPDGLLEADLMQCSLPIADVEGCKRALIRTSLVYMDQERRIKALAPVREYVCSAHPPAAECVRPLRDHLYQILMLWKSFRQLSAPECIPRIAANLGNLQSLLVWGLDDVEDASFKIRRILTLDSFLRATGRPLSSLRDRIPELFERCSDHQLHGEYITLIFETQHFYESKELPADLAARGIREFQLANDPVGEVQLLNVLSTYYLYNNDDPETAEAYCHRALSLAADLGDSIGEGKAWMHQSEIQRHKGQSRLGQKSAQKAAEAFRLKDHLVAVAYAIRAEADCSHALSNFRRSAELCAMGRDLLTAGGMESSPLISSLMSTEAEIHLLRTDYAQARKIQNEIVRRTSGSVPLEHAYAVLGLATIDCASEVDEKSVRQNLDVARAMFTDLQSPGAIFSCDAVDADLQLRRGLLAEACTCYETWFSTYRSRPDFALACLSKLADPTHQMHGTDSTFAYAMVLLAYARKYDNSLGAHHALRCIGDILVGHGDEETAFNLFTAALDGFRAMDIFRDKAVCMLRMGDILERRGEIGKAVDLLETARGLFARSSQEAQVSLLDRRLSALTS